MASALRTAALAAFSGVVVVFAAEKSRRRKTVYADTAFMNYVDIRDDGFARYHLINNFWVPHQHNLPLIIQDHILPLPQHAANLHNGDVEEPNGQEFCFDDPGFNLDMTAGAAAAFASSSLFHYGYSRKISLWEAITRCRRVLDKHREEIGDPGLVVGVSIDGHVVWREGFGYADFENRVHCHPDTVMRIASIGKAVSMTIIAQLWEQGLLDLDKPIQEYVPDFPQKTFNGEPVTVTCRQLVSHLSGIRHYSKTLKPDEETGLPAVIPAAIPEGNDKSNQKQAGTPKYNEFKESEYYIQKPYKTVAESVKLFKDDPLLGQPGEKYLYTTHGWTLLCAVIESVTKRKITDVLKDLFRDLGMQNTFLDEHEPIVYNRSRNYRRDQHGRLKNAPYVDNSYKWAGGGILSTVGDLLSFAHVLMYSYQWMEGRASGYLKPTTLQAMWTMVENTKKDKHADFGYGMGWVVVPERYIGSWCLRQPHVVYHTGGAIGASSVLTIIPGEGLSDKNEATSLPQGIAVTLIANLEQAALFKKSIEIAQIFDLVDLKIGQERDKR